MASSLSAPPLRSFLQTSSSRCWSICWVLSCCWCCCEMNRCRLRRFHQKKRRQCWELRHSIGWMRREGSMATLERPGWDGCRETGNMTQERIPAGPHPLRSRTDAKSPTLSSAPCAGCRNSTPQCALQTAWARILLSFSGDLANTPSLSLCLSSFSVSPKLSPDTLNSLNSSQLSCLCLCWTVPVFIYTPVFLSSSLHHYLQVLETALEATLWLNIPKAFTSGLKAAW